MRHLPGRLCPWNRKAPATQIGEFHPNDALTGRSLQQWLSLTPEQFHTELKDTPLSRPGWQGIIRNACIVAGNSRSRELLPQLEKLSGIDDPVVSEAAKWAIARIMQ